MIAWTLFLNPMPLKAAWMLWLLLPLLLAVAVVYKTVRLEHLVKLWREVTLLTVYMLAALSALGAALWAVQYLGT